MKKKIIAATLLVALATTSIATPKNETTPASSREISASSFKKLIVDKNIQVVLVTSDQTGVTVTGNKDYLQTITVSTDKDVMKISSTKNFRNKQVIVYVPVKGLSYIELKSGANVSSQGVLSCPKLSVLVNEGSKITLKNLGSVDIKSSEDCEFVYEKNEVVMIEYVK